MGVLFNYGLDNLQFAVQLSINNLGFLFPDACHKISLSGVNWFLILNAV